MKPSLSTCGLLGTILLGLTGCFQPTPPQTCPLPPVTKNPETANTSPAPDWRPTTTAIPTNFDGITIEPSHQAHVLISDQPPDDRNAEVPTDEPNREIGPPRQLLPSDLTDW